jgi:hypothetical protein
MKLALTSPTSGGPSIGIIRLRTTGHECFCFVFWKCPWFVPLLSLPAATLKLCIFLCYIDREWKRLGT